METIKEQINLSLESETEIDIEVEYIYAIHWFETKRHKKSHTTMFYINADDVKWVFETLDWFNNLVRVEYIKVSSQSREYNCAYLNSLKNNKDKDKKLNNSKNILYDC